MANRSYLFAVTDVPASYDDRPNRIASLSEWAYTIPLSYMLLVSSETRVCPSLCLRRDDPADQQTDPPLALIGNADGGYARLMRFLDLLAGSQAGAADADFLAARDETKAFLSARPFPYYFLETAELDAMSDGAFRAHIQTNLADVRRYTALVDSLTPHNIDAALAPGGALAGVLKELNRSEERELPTLGITFWTDILYYAPRSKADAAASARPRQPAAAPPEPAVTEPPTMLGRVKSWFGVAPTAKAPSPPVLAVTLTAADQAKLHASVDALVWSGFEARADIEDVARDELDTHAWTADDRAWLNRMVDAAWQDKQDAEATWPEQTRAEQLCHVFFELDTSGTLIAYPYAGDTEDDGWDACLEEWNERGAETSGIEGAIYFLRPDLDRVLKQQPLRITCRLTPGSPRTLPEITQRALAAFRAAGFAATSIGDTGQIEIPPLDWHLRSLHDDE